MMRDRETFISEYVDNFIKQWSLEVGNKLGMKYIDKEYAIIRIQARCHAAAIWEMAEKGNRLLP